jgi:superfamily II DNA or RNA helicase
VDDFSLWDHQVTAVELVREARRHRKTRIVLKCPPGGGKTEIACELIKSAREKGRFVAFTVPLLTLVNQAVERFRLRGIEASDLGVMQGKHELTNVRAPVQVISVQTLARRAFPLADVVIIDEAHIQFKRVKEWIAACPETTFLALSATPWAKGMADDYQELIVVETINGLIDRGVLCPYRTFAPALRPNVEGVRVVGGDYVEGELSEVMRVHTLVADVVKTWLEMAHDRPTLVFAVDRAHAAKLTEEFEGVGVRAMYVDADTEMSERAEYIEQLRTGEVQVIVSIGTMTCGVDIPWVSCISYVRPTRSQMLFVQSICRGLRAYEGKKDCLVIDHSTTTSRMGLVSDIDFPALRPGKTAKSASVSRETPTPLPWECCECHFLVPPTVHVCPECGFRRSPQSKITYVDGDLIEVTPGVKPLAKAKKEDAQSWSTEQKMQFYCELLGYAERYGKKRGFAYYKYKERFNVEPHFPFRDPQPIWPLSPATQSWIRSRMIAYARSMEKAS